MTSAHPAADRRHRPAGLVLACVAWLVVIGGAAAQPTAQSSPEVKPLGNGRYQVGPIVVDQQARSFTVPGRVLRTEPPLEYVAVTVGGVKDYESLLELDANAFEFNVACILIGLTTDQVRLPEYQFDPAPAIGPPVRITAQWDGPTPAGELDVAKLLWRDGEPTAVDDWVYLGSYHDQGEGSPYMAHEFGTLVGFVHDPASVLEHGAGIGIGQYGSVGGNTDLLPPLGTSLILRVTLAAAAASGD
jgi:hypothetical protein